MLTKSRDKMQRADAIKRPEFMYYPFAGDGDLPPITLRARTREDAQKQWDRIKGERNAPKQSEIV
jgi:hypothetical protein